ncbi:Flp pilus assembly protein CpaB [Castellaniella sp.]|uniref:Flp pilus assembly protein CpaB n=1 Tax=Castellaniella sp. TaxID=1955812 RepID=UPI003560D444
MNRWLAFLSRPLFLGILAGACGLLAALFLSQHVRERIQAVEREARLEMVERIVAAHDLLAGSRLEAGDLAVRSFPVRWVGRDALPAVRHLELQGKVLMIDVRAGDPVLPTHVQVPSEALSGQLAPGRRAVTLPVDQVNSLSGLLQPGDLIDLYVSFDHQRKRLTTPLLQGVQVLATGRETQPSENPDGSSYSTITLDAAPEDVIKLVAARQAGTLTAILRHPGDALANRLAARGDLASLLGVANPPPRPARRAVILYGSSGARGLPAWARGEQATSRPGNGWFDMPPDLQLSALARRANGPALMADRAAADPDADISAEDSTIDGAGHDGAAYGAAYGAGHGTDGGAWPQLRGAFDDDPDIIPSIDPTE